MDDRTQADASTITQEMTKLYDDHTHLRLDRRDFMQKLKTLTGAAAAAAAIAPLLAAAFQIFNQQRRGGLQIPSTPRVDVVPATPRHQICVSSLSL